MTGSRGLVSVMMPAHNAEKLVEEAINSLLSQTYAEWELLVVDDGSTDETARIVSSISDERITLVSQRSAGEAAARNRALDLAQGEFVAFLDADDRFLPDHLVRTVGHLCDRGADDAVYTDGYHIDDDGHRGSKLSSRRRGPFRGDIFEQVVRASDVFGPPICVVMRRSLIEENGLRFDPEIIIGPDWDFLVHVAEVGQFGYLNLPTCEYRVHASSITFSVDDGHRRESLARCRSKAIGCGRFGECSEATRADVFFDLLINQLVDRPDEQNRTVRSEQFLGLSNRTQARLLRLMASRALSDGHPNTSIGGWLRLAVGRNPLDIKAWALGLLYMLGPTFSQSILQLKTKADGQHVA